MNVIVFNNYSDVDFALHWTDFLVRDRFMSMHSISILKKRKLGRYVFMRHGNIKSLTFWNSQKKKKNTKIAFRPIRTQLSEP